MNHNKNTFFSKLDWLLIAIIVVLLLYSWGYLVLWYPLLPETIAIHFDALGKPNGYSSKENIWFAPLLFTLLSVAFIFGTKHQEAITFPKRKIGSIERKFNLKMMLYTALFLATLCPIIVFTMIKASVIKNLEMPWIMPMIIAIVLLYLPVILFYKFKTLKKS